MKYILENREQVEEFIRNEVLTTQEAIALLGISKGRMTQLLKSGAVKPVKELPRGSLFLRHDIEEKKKELEQLRKKYRPYDE
ncbi:helix-turn-helix domain-containing protein [Halalkalibacterium halodurans]|uniref:helix-turn-helix domain-containing protein n=1 Tax=Halalkalibacterium halodurans TaxID=86665 RepID=UPI0010FEE153|nr:helix-turn-helix domain-containing protein [Halalkalibacterium halodurans]